MSREPPLPCPSGPRDTNKIAEGLVGVQVTAEVAPQVQASLVLIRKEILSIETNLEPLLAGVIQPLLQDELDVVLNLLNDVITLVNGVEATVKNLLTTLPAGKSSNPRPAYGPAANVLAELQKTLQSELTAVLAILNPILTPVVSLVTGLVGSNTGVVVDQINGLVGTLNGLLGGLLNPLLGTLGAIL